MTPNYGPDLAVLRRLLIGDALEEYTNGLLLWRGVGGDGRPSLRGDRATFEEIRLGVPALVSAKLVERTPSCPPTKARMVACYTLTDTGRYAARLVCAAGVPSR